MSKYINEICKHCRCYKGVCSEDCEIYKGFKAEYDDEMEDKICSKCNGSGEGMHDGTTCTLCKGSGVENEMQEDPIEDYNDYIDRGNR